MKLTNTIELLRTAADAIEGRKPSVTERFLAWQNKAPPITQTLSPENKELVASLRNEADMLANDEFYDDDTVEQRRVRTARAL